MSKLHFVCRGGPYQPKYDANDPNGYKPPQVHFKENGCLYLILGIICVFLAPLTLLPSKIGFIPIEHDYNFLSLSLIEQYWSLLKTNGLIVLKKITGFDLFNNIYFPTIPDSGLGFMAITTIVVVNIAMLFFLGLGIRNIWSNLNKWKKYN